MHNKGSFTLPGEAGYEALTLRLAEKWGADVIRDSDGTALSEELLKAGFGIYSTICIIRGHNEWARQHPDALQQTFLMAGPVCAADTHLSIRLMDQFFEEQFQINDTPEALSYWQVYDRTAGHEVSRDRWTYDPVRGVVTLQDIEPFHSYTVNFLACQIWEQISMYNHVTNNWGDKEHLMPIDPMHPEAKQYLLEWMQGWCREHPDTTVVRFTSLFYNFVWIWGADKRNRSLFTDWASYDFTVSPRALKLFEQTYGYALCAEDFIHQGDLHATHMPAPQSKLDWMEFINTFVTDLGRRLVDITHQYGKQAYLFYDDSWVGTEPYGKHFAEMGFDGIIKCVFSGYEARLCSSVPAATHELRLHPYLFPVGLGGAPTFSEGGDPVADARAYWMHVRRGILRAPIQRLGLGGYLHLTENFPDFQDYIASLMDDFRQIKALHETGAPHELGIRVAVLHFWGRLRSWTLSGHFHETDMHDLIHVNEALSGLPVSVSFINFQDIKDGILDQVDVVINAGRAGDAWSGGDVWKDPDLVSSLTRFVYQGGCFIGIDEPSAAFGAPDFFCMAPVLGVGEDTGARVCHGRWGFALSKRCASLVPEGAQLPVRAGRYLTDGRAEVLMADGHNPLLTRFTFGNGTGYYLSGFTYSEPNTRLLLNLLLDSRGKKPEEVLYLTDNPYTECAYFPQAGELVIVNSADKPLQTRVLTEEGEIIASLPPFGQVIKKMRRAADVVVSKEK